MKIEKEDRKFWISLLICISLSVINYIFLGFVSTGFVMTIVMTFEIKFALRKNKSVYNPLKNLYYHKEKLETYRKICIFMYWVYFVLAIDELIEGFIEKII